MMSSTDDEEIFDVVCIGAGFSGLTAAYKLRKAKPDLHICVLEAKGSKTIGLYYMYVGNDVNMSHRPSMKSNMYIKIWCMNENSR